MASTYSTSLKLELIGNGDQSGTWGTTTNNNLGTLLEQAITGVETITMFNTDYTLTNYNGASDEARNAVIIVSGTNSAVRNVVAPAVEKVYIVSNQTTGGFAINIKTPASTGIQIPNGATYLIYCDASEFYAVTKAFSTANTPDTLVLRDGSGNFAAGTITATTFAGQLSGTITSATTATTQAPGDNSTRVATTAFVTNVAGSLGTMSTQNANNVAITGGSITGITDLAVADGGTGASTLSANAVLLGNGTSALQTVAPSTSGNVLTSNGTTWTSAAPVPSIGVGQTWTDVTGSRAINTTYTNSTGRPIQVSISVQSQTASGCYLRFYINGVVVARQGSSQNDSADVRANVSLIIPNGNTYRLENAEQAGNNGQGQIVLQTWFELR
jgi:hypothetical protein